MTSDPTAAGGPAQRLRGTLRRGARSAPPPKTPVAPGVSEPPAAPAEFAPIEAPADDKQVTAPVDPEPSGTSVDPEPPVAPEEASPSSGSAPPDPVTPPKDLGNPDGFRPAGGASVVVVPARSGSTVDDIPVVTPGTVVPPAPGATPVQRGPRKARLQIRQVDPWSVMKLGFLLSLALGIVFVVAVALLWSLLDSGGVFDSINKVVADVANDQTDFTVQGSLAFRRVMGVTLVLAVVQVVLITALATLAAFLYNLASGLVGGLDVTLVEET